MFTVKMFSNGVAREKVFYDLDKAREFFNDLSIVGTVSHAKLLIHKRVVVEY